MGSEGAVTTETGDKGPCVDKIIAVAGANAGAVETDQCRFTVATEILAPGLTLEESLGRCMEVLRFHLKDGVEACCRAFAGSQNDWITATNAVRHGVTPRGLPPLRRDHAGVVWDVQAILTTLSAFERTGQWPSFKRLFPDDAPLDSLRLLNRMRDAIARTGDKFSAHPGDKFSAHPGDETIDPDDALAAIDAAARLLAAAGKGAASQVLAGAWTGLVRQYGTGSVPPAAALPPVPDAASDMRADPQDRVQAQSFPTPPGPPRTDADGKRGGCRRARGWYVTIPFVGHHPDAPADLGEFQFVRRNGVVFRRADGEKPLRFGGQAPLLHVQLQAIGLLQEAQRVHGAVSKLPLRHSGWKTPGQRLSGANWLEEIHVCLVSPPDSAMKGSSVTLGLALGVLMAATRPRRRVVIATGALAAHDGRNDRVVDPVGGIDQKIAEVRRRWTKTDEDVLFLVPFQDRGGNPLTGSPDQRKAAFAAIFQTQIADLQAVGIALRPVETLEEAARLVGATELAATGRDRGMTALAATALVCGLAWGGFSHWHDRPLGLTWKPLGGQTVTAGEAPFFRSRTFGMERPLNMVRLTNGVQAACAGEFVGVRVGVPADAGAPVSLAAVFFTDRLTRDTKPKVVTLPEPVKPGESPYFILEMGATPETNAVMVVAQRWPSTVRTLQAELDGAFDLDAGSGAKPKTTDIFSIRNYLDSRFMGRTLYGTFEVIKGEDETCR